MNPIATLIADHIDQWRVAAEPIIIGICGSQASGKPTASAQVAEHFYSLGLTSALATAWEADWSAGVDMFADAQNLFVLGRGLTLGIAQEAALKFKETCGIHGEAFSIAEVAHGPMALIAPGLHAVTGSIVMVQSFYRLVNALAVRRGFDPDHPPMLHKVTQTL